MNDLTISCPKCKHVIKLTEELAGPLLEATRREHDRELADLKAAIAANEAKIKESADAAAKEKAQKLVKEQLGAKQQELDAAEKELVVQSQKLAEAQKAQADFLKKQRVLDEEKRELDLTIEKRVSAGVASVRSSAQQEAEERFKLQLAEKQHVMEAMQQQIESLKKKAEQGSQQLQGEVQERALEQKLKERFPADTIEPVAKGVRGADVAQTVVTGAGMAVGTILWESKRTKSFSDSWLPKLRDDQRAAKADIAVLVSEAMPSQLEGAAAGVMDGVWVVHYPVVLALACALRQQLIEVVAARKSGEGLETKAAIVYGYFTGSRFKQRVQAIVEAFSTMKEDLDRERKAIMKQWAKREEQIERVMGGTIGMFGDLQGIAGKEMAEVEGLDLKQLIAPGGGEL